MRILFISARPPLPVRRGDQARLAGWLRVLGRRHEVSVLALRPPGVDSAPLGTLAEGRLIAHPRWRMLRGLVGGLGKGNRPLQVSMHHSPRLETALDRALGSFRPDVMVTMLSRMAWVLDPLAARKTSPPVVVDLVDSLALNLRRRAARASRGARVLRGEAARMAAWDADVVARVAAATVVASADRDAIANGDPALAARIDVVPFGLTLPDSLPAVDASRTRPIVLLSGNLGYFPTVDAARAFARDVWPRIRKAHPDAEWWLAGARPARAIRRIAREAGAREGIRLIADPPDLGAIRRQAMLSIAPLRAGSGTPIKVLEAMADGVPVVTTRRGRAGLEGIDESALTVADTPDEQVEAILGLLDDPVTRRAQAESAFAWVRGRHDLETVARRFESVLESALESAGAETMA